MACSITVPLALIPSLIAIVLLVGIGEKQESHLTVLLYWDRGITGF